MNTRGMVLAAATAACLFSNAILSTHAQELNEGSSSGSQENSSGWALPLPKITLPKITMPKITMPKMETSPMEPIRASARKIGDGSKKAWEGAKEILTFGRSSDPAESQTTSRPQPSIWKRMFGGEEQADSGPQTIGEFMSGERLK
ncbi:MAG: hypothetical protein KDA61_17225 [Planctomycetales bacterium]|nr:hypothetical protein [Planctomycetales bacterium]